MRSETILGAITFLLSNVLPRDKQQNNLVSPATTGIIELAWYFDGLIFHARKNPEEKRRTRINVVGRHPVLRVLSVITAFMNGNTPDRERIRGRHGLVEGITEVHAGYQPSGAFSTRDSPSSKLQQAWKRSSWKLLSYFSHPLRLASPDIMLWCLTFPCHWLRLFARMDILIRSSNVVMKEWNR